MTRYQRIFEKNIQTKQAYIDHLKAMNPSLLHVQRNQKWSAMQICEHVLRIEQATYSNIKTHWNKKKRLPIRAFLNARLLVRALASEKQFKVPAIESIIPPNALSLDELIQEWTASQENWFSFLGEKQKGRFYVAFHHPIAGYLNMDQTLEQLNVHSLRHLKQLQNL